MKKKDIALVSMIIILLIVLSLVLFIVYFQYFKGIISPANNTEICKYTDINKNYIKKTPNCIINFLCIKGTIGFSDSCGCGCKKVLEINCTSYDYESCPTGCVICPPCQVCSSLRCNTKEFCNSIGFNDTWYSDMFPKKYYCTKEQKNAKVCPEYYSATCGWFNESIKCLKYPCAMNFENPCFACASANVDYYTAGECPK